MDRNKNRRVIPNESKKAENNDESYIKKVKDILNSKSGKSNQ